jgi:hypothetical protein
MAYIPIHIVEPHNITVEADPEHAEGWRIVLWSQAVHHVLISEKQLENLGREIASKLQAKTEPSARQ